MKRSFRVVPAIAAAALAAACSLEDQTIGPQRGDPAGGSMFRVYSAIGTSISAGFQSGGLNDSTQREGFAYRLAVQMGLTPGVDWLYPKINMPGCPAPLSNALTSARVGGATATGCAFRAASSITELVHNTGVPSVRAAHVLNIADATFVPTDSLTAAVLLIGSRNPMDLVEEAGATFVTLEVGANDVLGGATRGDTTLLTPTASFDASMDAIATRLNALGASVAISNVPNVTSIPHMTLASVAWCLKNGVCPGIAAAAPFNVATFTIDNSCAPAAAVPGAVGDNTRLAFRALGAMMAAIAAGRSAKMDCGRDSSLIGIAGPAPNNPLVPTTSVGGMLTPAEMTAIGNRVTAFNTKIQALATANNWAHVDFAALLAAQAANIPVFPSLTTPTNLFGTLFSQDGVHPTAAGHKIIANGFIAAINARYGSSLAVIP